MRTRFWRRSRRSREHRILSGGCSLVVVDLKCKDCDKWYGAEDDEFGPCMIKHMRGDKKYLTHGMHICDEEEGRVGG